MYYIISLPKILEKGIPNYSDRNQMTDYQRLKRGGYDCKGVEEEMGNFGGEKTSAS